MSIPIDIWSIFLYKCMVAPQSYTVLCAKCFIILIVFPA